MKRLQILILLIFFSLATAFAGEVVLNDQTGIYKKKDFGIGLNLGTTSGLSFRYGCGPFDILSDLNFDVVKACDKTIRGSVSIGLGYDVFDFKKKDLLGTVRQVFPFSVGMKVVLGIEKEENDDAKFLLEVLVPLQIETMIGQNSSLYLRFSPGAEIMPSVTFAYEAMVGMMLRISKNKTE